MRTALMPTSLILSLALVPTVRADDEKPPRAESYLLEGKLEAGERDLTEALKADPKDDQARFGLGVIQFVRAVEARMQSFYKYGYRIQAGGQTITNLPVPKNPKPETLDARQARKLLQDWLDDLAKVEKTLSGITRDDVRLPLHFGRIKLDFNVDGKLEEDETLGAIYKRFNGLATPEAIRGFHIQFDRGDVDWLRGYCRLLSALAEVILAHDFSEPFDTYGFLIFEGMKPKYDFQREKTPRDGFNFDEIFDAVAFIHQVRLPVAEPKRLKSALEHLESVSKLSRSSWKLIREETDNDHEWIPNPKQDSVVPNGSVTREQIETWYVFLDEWDDILAGKKLVPFWRGNNPKRGLNVHKVFTEPAPLDLILWIQGSGVASFLENGEVTSPAVWERINRVFHGEFVGFAIWFN